MKNAKQNNILKYMLIFAMVLCSLLFVEPRNTVRDIAYAEDAVQYSDVLTDLHKDSKFDESAYPEDIEDYSISLITIAEGENGDVFAYVYQPCGSVKDYRASSINVSTSINNALDVSNYHLVYCNSNGVFYKYKINGIKVTNDEVRYYYIPSIFRPFDGQIDDPLSAGNTEDETPFRVSKQYEFGTINGKYYLDVTNIDIINITDKFVGFLRCFNGTSLKYEYYTDLHFVAFNTDYDIDDLLEADVQYVAQESYENESYGNHSCKLYEPKDEKVYLKAGNYNSADGKGWFFKKDYTWEQIQTVDEFLAEATDKKEIYSGAVLNVSRANKITDEAMNELRNKEWVLRFASTDYEQEKTIYVAGSQPFYEWRGTSVGAVTILRLKFISNGKPYNLGAIDNKQTGSSEPINPGWKEPFGGDVTVTLTPKSKETMSTVLIVLICICAVMLLIPVFKAIYQHKKSKHKESSSPKRSSSSTRRTKSSNKKPNKKTSKKR